LSYAEFLSSLHNMQQVDRSNYRFSKYSSVGRWAGYYHQINEVLAQKPTSVLEVGKGDSVVGNYLKDNCPVSYKCLDIAKDLNPDIVGDVTNIPLEDNSFDIACCFQVLEHLPFEKFSIALAELARVAKSAVIISLPHPGPTFSMNLKMPGIRHIKFVIKIPWSSMHKFNGQHFWEIGKKGYSLSKIRSSLRTIGRIEKDFIPAEDTYHHFFVIKL